MFALAGWSRMRFRNIGREEPRSGENGGSAGAGGGSTVEGFSCGQETAQAGLGRTSDSCDQLPQTKNNRVGYPVSAVRELAIAGSFTRVLWRRGNCLRAEGERGRNEKVRRTRGSASGKRWAKLRPIDGNESASPRPKRLQWMTVERKMTCGLRLGGNQRDAASDDADGTSAAEAATSPAAGTGRPAYAEVADERTAKEASRAS